MTKRTSVAPAPVAVPPPPLPCLAQVTPPCETPRTKSGFCEAHTPPAAPVRTGQRTHEAVNEGMGREQEAARQHYLRDDVTCQRCANESVERYPNAVACEHHAGRVVDYVDGAAWRVTFIREGSR